MPWAKVLRSGQITFPKEIREKLGIKEGDIVDFEIQGSMVIMRPKVLVDKEAALTSFARGFDRLQASFSQEAREMPEGELEEIIEEAVQQEVKPKVKKRK